jgi:hypothetical protein
VLVLDTRRGDVTRVDPRTGQHRRVLHVMGFPTSIAVGAGAAWIVDARSGKVTRLKPYVDPRRRGRRSVAPQGNHEHQDGDSRGNQPAPSHAANPSPRAHGGVRSSD